MTGVLSTRDRYCLGDILLGLYNYDSKRAAKAIVTLTNYESDSTSLMERMLESLFDKYSHINLNDIKITEVFHEITKMMSSLSIKVPNQMHILIKTLITIEGVGRRLYPDFNIFDHISPFAKNLIKSRLSPKKLIKDIYLATLDMTMLVKDLPFELHEILYKAKNGRLKMIYEIKNMESLLMTVEKITNRISFSIVLAALIIGSSLIVLAKVPPLWNNIPLIGIAGYIAAGLMGFGLLIDIIRNKKM
jgi:ubiquinone biosynthesis protein